MYHSECEMPLTYEYCGEDHTIRVHCFGELTKDHMVKYFRDVEKDAAIGCN